MRWLLFCLSVFASPAVAVTCEDISYVRKSYTICTVSVSDENLRLFHSDDAGAVLGSFSAIRSDVQPKQLLFAMNAGMYHADRAPVGHYVEDGVEKMRVITNAGPGNFGLLPNGILCVNDDSARVYETLDYVDKNPQCRDATQSGPMLVVDGELHPRFLPESTSRFIRNGVGTTEDGSRAVFAISNDPVTFHEFGSVFRDHLKLDNALFFDGKVSRLYAQDLGRSDFGFQLGPIIGVVAD